MDGRADRLGGEYLRVKFFPLPEDVLSFIAGVARLFALVVFSALFLLWRARLADSKLFPHTKQLARHPCIL